MKIDEIKSLHTVIFEPLKPIVSTLDERIFGFLFYLVEFNDKWDKYAQGMRVG
jgi:hypothetical protein